VQDAPRWHMVDIQLVRRLKRMITLEELKGYKEGELAGMVLLNRSRLSVQPVTQQQWDFILALEDKELSGDDSAGGASDAGAGLD
jgi:predicted RNA-binding protein with PUA-like domain